MPYKVSLPLVILIPLNNHEVVYINQAPFDDRDYLRIDGVIWGREHRSPCSYTASENDYEKSAARAGDGLVVFLACVVTSGTE